MFKLEKKKFLFSGGVLSIIVYVFLLCFGCLSLWLGEIHVGLEEERNKNKILQVQTLDLF